MTQNDDQGVETSMKPFLSYSPIIIIHLQLHFWPQRQYSLYQVQFWNLPTPGGNILLLSCEMILYSPAIKSVCLRL